ncbi:MAG TPA: hypothetical protein VMG81_01215 [Thermoplasmata archaeon]|nr:hypothetical protein [Thermoplasmata archaeon]
MRVRTVLSIVNFAILGIVILVVLLYPSLDVEAFYFLLGWMIASFALFYLPLGGRRAGAGPPLGSAGAGFPGADPAAPGAPPAAPLGSLGFCIYCAAPMTPGTPTCPACGYAAPRF